MCHDIHGTGKPANRKHRTSGSRYLHLSNVMDTKDMLITTTQATLMSGNLRHRLNTGYRSPKTPGPGAVAHMSLHLNQQCQRSPSPKRPAPNSKAGQPSPPAFQVGGQAVRLCWRPTEELLKQRPRPVKRHIWTPNESVNHLFQKSSGPSSKSRKCVGARPSR